MLYDNSEIFNNMTIWLPTEDEPEYIGTENLARVFNDCEVSKIFSLAAKIMLFFRSSCFRRITTILRFIMKTL